MSYLSVWLLLVAALHIGEGKAVEVYMRQEVLVDGYYGADFNVTTYSLSDGHLHIRASGDHSRQVLLGCHIDVNQQEIEHLEGHAYKVSVEDSEWSSLLRRCEEINNIYRILSDLHESGQYELLEVPHVSHLSREKREVKWTLRSTVRPDFIPEGNKLGNVLILNGTVWCGTGNMAGSFDDLGYYATTDQCCRSHDYCRDFIPMLSTKYGYSNLRPYTISHCDCDYEFYRCLKAAGTDKAEEVGDFFFNTVGVPCFNLEYGEFCADSSSFLFCSNKAFGTTVALNYVLSNIWATQKNRVSLGN